MAIGLRTEAGVPVLAGQSGFQGGLAAGAEATVNIPFPANLVTPANPNAGASVLFGIATVGVAAGEANVQYVAEVSNVAPGATSVNVKVRNVGTAAGVQAWWVNLVVFGRDGAIGI